MVETSKWVEITDADPTHSQRYIDRFAKMAEEGRTWPARPVLPMPWCREERAFSTQVVDLDGSVRSWWRWAIRSSAWTSIRC